MAILWGDTGKVAYGSLKTFNFQTPMREVSLGTVTLPNAEGTSNQVSFTIQQSDLPTITPNAFSMKYAVLVIASGKCVTAATVNYRIFKNGTSLNTSSSTGTANQYWTHNHYRWYDISAGDVLEVRCWSNQTDTNIDYACLLIYPANVVLSKANTILKDLTYTNGTTTSCPKPTGLGLRTVTDDIGASNGFFPINNSVAIGSTNGLIGVGVMSGTPIIFPYLWSSSLGTFRTNYDGDINGLQTKVGSNSATAMTVIRNGIPASISFREILR